MTLLKQKLHIYHTDTGSSFFKWLIPVKKQKQNADCKSEKVIVSCCAVCRVHVYIM